MSKSAAESLAKADALIHDGNNDAAEKLLQSIVASGERVAKVHANLGRIAMRRNDRIKAIKYYEEAVDLDRTTAAYMRDLGIIYLLEAKDKNSLQLAIKGQSMLKQAIAIDPSNVMAQTALIQFYQQAPVFVGGSQTKAKAQIQDLKKHDPFYGSIQEAQMEIADQKWADARVEVEEAVALRPNALPALRLVAELGRSNSADSSWAQEQIGAVLLKLPADKKRDRVELLCLLGGVLDVAGKPDDATTHYRKALELDPNCEEAHNYLSTGSH